MYQAEALATPPPGLTPGKERTRAQGCDDHNRGKPSTLALRRRRPITAIVDDFGAIRRAMPSAEPGGAAPAAPARVEGFPISTAPIRYGQQFGPCLLLAVAYGLPERWYLGNWDGDAGEWCEENGLVVSPRKWCPLPTH